MSGPVVTPLEFVVPDHSAASMPPEQEGRRRDGVRLMVADATTDTVRHTTFAGIGEALRPGDVLVVNVSAAVPAAVDGIGDAGCVRLHLSSPVAGDLWTVEPRRPGPTGSERWKDFDGGVVTLPGGAEAHLLVPDARSPRLWITELRSMGDPVTYLQRHGRPIRYNHTGAAIPMSMYQTVYASEPGSAEMPSAGRPFTTSLITSLATAGVVVAPLVLHCGVASFEAGEGPDNERFRIPATTARLVNQARAAGGRVVAVGTTSVRALETMADSDGIVHPGSGITDLIVTPERGVRAIDALVTGWHEAGASHLDLVEAVAGRPLLERSYTEALAGGYLWHEFGDSLLVLRSA